MTVPSFAPFPSAKVRQNIPPLEWNSYVDSWNALTDLYLRLSEQDFSSAISGQESLSTFLTSFLNELVEDPALTPSVLPLRRKAFILVHRIWSGSTIPSSFLNWSFISNLFRAYPKSEQLRKLLQNLWKRKGEEVERSLQTAKISVIRSLESKTPDSAGDSLDRFGPLLRLSSDAGAFMLTGSDFLDSLGSAYSNAALNFQKKLVTIAYLGLIALLEGPKPQYSLLSDHLYSLKTSAEQSQKSSSANRSLLADLVTNTPLLNKIRDNATTPEGVRVKNTAASLSTFQQADIARPKRLVRRKVDKGKNKVQTDEYGHGAFGEVHVHRMSMISQIQDLFPDLGSGFVVKLLDEYNDNVEEITAHLLEDSLPSHLDTADRNEQLPTAAAAPASHLPPRYTPPPTFERRNVFDNDEFDRLAVDTSRLHIGRRDQELTADHILSDRSNAPNKSAILSALAAFDLDDDERDDTYDAEDVGGTVDSAAPGPDEVDADLRDKNEETLFKAFTISSDVFGRDAETRRGKARAALKSETGMTDEAIEGWGIMIGREPKRLRRLEMKFSTFSGQQRELASTAYRESPADSGEDTVGDGQRGGRGGHPGRGRGRGRGRGGGGRGGGNVAGPNDDKSTQASRQRKEASKGSRANHNRRDQRAKKMARGGLPG